MAVVPFEDSKNLGSLLDVNQLDYRLAPSLSVAVSRACKTYPAHRESYSAQDGDSVILTCTSGGQYVDLLNSYIRFTVTADQPFEIPSKQSMLNLFKGIRLIHSSGEEIDRVNGVLALWNTIRLGHSASADRQRSQFDLFHYNDTSYVKQYQNLEVNYGIDHKRDFSNREKIDLHAADAYVVSAGAVNTGTRLITFAFDGASRYADVNDFVEVGDWVTYADQTFADKVVEVTSATEIVVLSGLQSVIAGTSFSVHKSSKVATTGLQTQEVVIPLACLHQFFNNMKLAPVYLVSGMRIELDLERPNLVFPTLSAQQNYTISKCSIDLESIAITDGISRRLAQISGSRGLVWNWDTVYTTTTFPRGLDHSVQITKAVSRANTACFFVRNTEQLSSYEYDSLNSSTNAYDDFDFTSYQFALGAEFMPIRPLSGVKQFHQAALKCFEQFRRVDELVSGEANNDLGRLAMACTSLESSTTLAQAGVAINSQRTAVATMIFNDDTKKDWKPNLAFRNARRVDMFLTAEKVAIIMLDSISLRS